MQHLPLDGFSHLKFMNVPNPPFRTVTEELLYNIYLKVQAGSNTTGLTADDINTIAKLNAILQDADLMSAEQITNSIAALKGNVPTAANTLEKLYNIIQGLTYLKREDIDALAELNAIILDADIVKTEDLTNSLNALKGNVPVVANSLEKLYNIIQGITYLKREDIDTIGELNAILTDADLVRITDLADALVALNLKRKTIQFYFPNNHWDDDHDHNNSRDTYVFRGKINSLSQDFTNELSGVTYKSRLDTSNTWANHSNLAALQTWINTSIAGDEQTGTKYWIKCLPVYKSVHDDEAVNVLTYNV